MLYWSVAVSLALIATGALALSAPASAAPLPQLWTACFSEEGGSGANECDGPGGIAADPNTPGHVYVADSSNNRINEFNAWGAFVKSWGWGVRDGSLEPQTCGPEATPPSASCQKGIAGPRGGQLGAGAVAVDSAGDVYVIDAGNHRIQKFGPDGGFLRAWGGGVVSGGATGSGDLNGTTTVSNLVATDKAFRVGQTVTSSDGGIPAGTTITNVTTGLAATLTLSQPATTTQSGVTLTAARGQRQRADQRGAGDRALKPHRRHLHPHRPGPPGPSPPTPPPRSPTTRRRRPCRRSSRAPGAWRATSRSPVLPAAPIRSSSKAPWPTPMSPS